MTTLTLHNIDNEIAEKLKLNAMQHNCSIEEEVYQILKQTLLSTDKSKNLASYLNTHVIALTGGEELELVARSLPHTVIDFSENTL